MDHRYFPYFATRFLSRIVTPGGELPYIKGGDARRKISNEALKGTNLDVAEAEFYP